MRLFRTEQSRWIWGFNSPGQNGKQRAKDYHGSDYTDRYMGSSVLKYIDTICLWYDASSHNFLANTTVNYANGNKSLPQATYMEAGAGTGTNDSQASAPALSFYPNPAREYIQVNNESGEQLLIEILDIRGVLVKTQALQPGTHQVPVVDLTAGIYILKYSNASTYQTEKLLIE